MAFQGQTPYEIIAERDRCASRHENFLCNTHRIAQCEEILRVSPFQEPRVGELFRRLIHPWLLDIQDSFLPTPAPRSSPVLSSILAQCNSAERIQPVLPIFVDIPINTDRREPTPPGPYKPDEPYKPEQPPYKPTPPGPKSARDPGDYNPPSPTSPVSRLPCIGWCVPDPNVKAPTMVSFSSVLYVLCTQAQRLFMYIQVSLAAYSDDQRSWEAYRSSLARVVCNFLGKHMRFLVIFSL